MSYDLAVLSAKRHLTPEDAAEAYERLCEEEDAMALVEPDGRIDAFVAEITARWPEIDDVRDDDIDGSPWNVAFDRSPGHIISAISWDRVDEVMPIYIETALRHGLYVYDPQEDFLHAPPG